MRLRTEKPTKSFRRRGRRNPASFIERYLRVVLEALFALAAESPDQDQDEKNNEREQVDGVVDGVHAAILKAAQSACAVLHLFNTNRRSLDRMCAFVRSREATSRRPLARRLLLKGSKAGFCAC